MSNNTPKVLAIITINYKELGLELEDLERFHRAELTGLEFEIPKVKVLKPGAKDEKVFEHKALLLNYGFIRMPLEYARDPGKLTRIKNSSRVIRGFFYSSKVDIDDEQYRGEAAELAKESGELSVAFAPVLVKTVSEDQLVLLNAEAQKLDVYDSVEELGPGSYLVVKTYPFAGLSAKVVKTKTNGKIQIELLDAGLRVWLDKVDLVYTIYDDPNNFKV